MYENDSTWMKGLQFFAGINFVTGIVGGGVFARQIGLLFGEARGQMNIPWFLIVLTASIISTFLVSAVIFVYVDIARQARIAAANTIELVQKNNSKQNSDAAASSPWKCRSCEGHNPPGAGVCTKCGRSK